MAANSLRAPAGQTEPVWVLKEPLPSSRQRVLLATSGSCGLPNLVKLSDSNLRASARAVNERLSLSQTSVWLDCLPLIHIGGLSILLRCACADIDRDAACENRHVGIDADSQKVDVTGQVVYEIKPVGCENNERKEGRIDNQFPPIDFLLIIKLFAIHQFAY